MVSNTISKGLTWHLCVNHIHLCMVFCKIESWMYEYVQPICSFQSQMISWRKFCKRGLSLFKYVSVASFNRWTWVLDRRMYNTGIMKGGHPPNLKSTRLWIFFLVEHPTCKFFNIEANWNAFGEKSSTWEQKHQG